MAVHCHIAILFLPHINEKAKAESSYHRLCSNGSPFKIRFHHRYTCSAKVTSVFQLQSRTWLSTSVTGALFRLQRSWSALQHSGCKFSTLHVSIHKSLRARDVTEKGVPYLTRWNWEFNLPVFSWRIRWIRRYKTLLCKLKRTTADFRQFNLS